MKTLLQGLLAIVCVALSACGTSTKIVSVGDSKPLKGKIVCLVVELAGGSMTTSGIAVGGATGHVTSSGGSTSGRIRSSALAMSHTMDGSEQALLAAKDLELELRSAGLKMARRPDEAEVIAAFYIGSCRFDPVAGWIADKSFVDFRDAKTGESIAMIRGDTRFITPTIRSHIRNLTDATKQLL